MPNSSNAINQAISDFLKNDYSKEYVENILAATVAITNYYPAQADSQIRDAMTHLARCASNPENGEKELEKAKDHLERAKRDCLKIAIFTKKKDIKEEIKSLRFAKSGLPEDIQKLRLDIAIQHKKAYAEEALGKKDISNKLEEVLIKLITLENMLIEFDKIAKPTSLPVKIAFYTIAFLKKISQLFGVGLMVYFIGKLISYLFK